MGTFTRLSRVLSRALLYKWVQLQYFFFNLHVATKKPLLRLMSSSKDQKFLSVVVDNKMECKSVNIAYCAIVI